ncbi:MAG: hypothetical protein AB3N15_10530 [Paracoccaceae bacterium]
MLRVLLLLVCFVFSSATACVAENPDLQLPDGSFLALPDGATFLTQGEDGYKGYKVQKATFTVPLAIIELATTIQAQLDKAGIDYKRFQSDKSIQFSMLPVGGYPSNISLNDEGDGTSWAMSFIVIPGS